MYRPVLWWFAASSLLFLWRYHYTQAAKATMQFTISIEGRQGQTYHEAALNGRPYHASEPCGVGWKRLVVRARDAEQFATNCFVWYGGADFGNITLTRSRGQLDLDFSPTAKIVTVIGAEERHNLENVTHQSLSMPTGRYAVETRFQHFSIDRTVELTHNQTNRVAIAPRLAALNLSSEPDSAEFHLQTTKPPEVSLWGTTPATISDLPTGQYTLEIWRGDYRKNLTVSLTGINATDEMKVQFRYAKVAVTSDPVDAEIRVADKVLGKTPATIDLQPGLYRLAIVKDGYFGTNVSVDLSETDTRSLSVALVNASFVEALQRARYLSSGFSADHAAALTFVDKALQIKPGDETALDLKRTIEFRRHIKIAKQFQTSGDFDRALAEIDAALKLSANAADALALKVELVDSKRKAEQDAVTARTEVRRNRPQKELKDITSSMRYEQYFQTQIMHFNGSLENVREAVLRALGHKPEWSLRRNHKVDEDLAIIQADAKGFGSKRTVVITLGQTADNEVTVCFKLFALVLGNIIELTLGGIPEDSYKPLHPQFLSGTRGATADRDRERDLQEFKKRIESELH